ncbi:MAG: T9SS type A sorting domain-containing protein [Elusimicrobiota bacterium]
MKQKIFSIILNIIIVLLFSCFGCADVILTPWGLVINSYASITCKRSVVVTLVYYPNNNEDIGTPREMIISEKQDFSDGKWLRYYDSYMYNNKADFTLSPGDGIKTVYAKCRSADMKESRIFSDTILYKAPVGIVINDYASESYSCNISLRISTEGIVDSIGNFTEVIVSENSSFQNVTWLAYTKPFDLNFKVNESYGEKYVYAKFREASLQESKIYSDSILLKIPVKNNLNEFMVYPNPYYPMKGHTQIYFYGLTEYTEIKIYDLVGNLIKKLYPIDSMNGISIWDTKNESGENVASGIYIFSVNNDKYNGKLWNSPPNQQFIYGKIAVIR